MQYTFKWEDISTSYSQCSSKWLVKIHEEYNKNGMLPYILKWRESCSVVSYTVHEILQGRIPEWVAFPFSRGFSQLKDQTQVSHIKENSLPAELQAKTQNK